MSKLKKKLSLPSGSSAVTGGRKPLVRHSSVNLPVNRRLNTPTKGTVSDSGVFRSGEWCFTHKPDQSYTPTSPSRGGVVVIGGESDVPHFGFSSKTCLDILPALTIDQLKFEIIIIYLKIFTTATTKQGYVNAITSVLQKN